MQVSASTKNTRYRSSSNFWVSLGLFGVGGLSFAVILKSGLSLPGLIAIFQNIPVIVHLSHLMTSLSASFTQVSQLLLSTAKLIPALTHFVPTAPNIANLSQLVPSLSQLMGGPSALPGITQTLSQFLTGGGAATSSASSAATSALSQLVSNITQLKTTIAQQIVPAVAQVKASLASLPSLGSQLSGSGKMSVMLAKFLPNLASLKASVGSLLNLSSGSQILPGLSDVAKSLSDISLQESIKLTKMASALKLAAGFMVSGLVMVGLALGWRAFKEIDFRLDSKNWKATQEATQSSEKEVSGSLRNTLIQRPVAWLKAKEKTLTDPKNEANSFLTFQISSCQMAILALELLNGGLFPIFWLEEKALKNLRQAPKAVRWAVAGLTAAAVATPIITSGASLVAPALAAAAKPLLLTTAAFVIAFALTEAFKAAKALWAARASAVKANPAAARSNFQKSALSAQLLAAVGLVVVGIMLCTNPGGVSALLIAGMTCSLVLSLSRLVKQNPRSGDAGRKVSAGKTVTFGEPTDVSGPGPQNRDALELQPQQRVVTDPTHESVVGSATGETAFGVVSGDDKEPIVFQTWHKLKQY